MTILQSVQLLTVSLVFREGLNAFLAILFTNLSWMVAYFMWITWREHRGKWTSWADAPGMQTACCLTWLFGIIALRSFLVWAVLWTAHRGHHLPWWFESMGNIALISSAFGLGIVGLRSMHIFSPVDWGNKAWIASLVSAAIFTLVTMIM